MPYAWTTPTGETVLLSETELKGFASVADVFAGAKLEEYTIGDTTTMLADAPPRAVAGADDNGGEMDAIMAALRLKPRGKRGR